MKMNVTPHLQTNRVSSHCPRPLEWRQCFEISLEINDEIGLEMIDRN